MTKVISKLGIPLLNSGHAVAIIETIESFCPGWVWSFSQEPKNIRLTLMSSPEAHFKADREFASTHEGGNGILFDYAWDQKDAFDVITFVERSIDSLNIRRKIAKATDVFVDIAGRKNTYRYQNLGNLIDFKNTYGVLLRDLSLIEDHGHNLTEVYLGSCDLSIDSSLRGVRPDGSRFDCSVDLLDREVGLGESLSWALMEMKSDVLTVR